MALVVVRGRQSSPSQALTSSGEQARLVNLLGFLVELSEQRSCKTRLTVNIQVTGGSSPWTRPSVPRIRAITARWCLIVYTAMGWDRYRLGH